MKKMMRVNWRVMIAIVLSLVSFFMLSKYASSPETYKKTIASLDDKKATATGLAASATAASVAISAIPSDVATPVADELAELSSYFIIILGAIYLEKFLLTIIGYVVFKFFIPVACILYIIDTVQGSEIFRNIIKKVITISLVVILIIPGSEKISTLIQATYDTSIQETIDSVSETIKIEEDEEGGISAIWGKVKDGVSSVYDTVKNTLDNFIEAIGVMIVTTCVIPIITMLFFVWVIKFILGVNINLPEKGQLMIVQRGMTKIKQIMKSKKEEVE
ncbi:MAG: hypothetical protein SPE99_10625 [Blautia sp.]|nr:hypothetical protein [Blautia sp.]